MFLMNIIRIAIIFIIIYAVLKNLKTLLKAGVIIFVILLLLGFIGF
ncbi:hypothetical protein [Methanobrevibacter sp.]|nr:hypothetical protein [Methanobrevibacter sp.]MBQ2832151.1 hypothetical protein [Methanobrevibacter sp.]